MVRISRGERERAVVVKIKVLPREMNQMVTQMWPKA